MMKKVQQNQRQKAVFSQSLDQMIQANNSVDQLLALLANNFADQFNEMSPQIMKELENAKRHLQNVSFVFRSMQK